ncbi:hypothetical protein ACF06N_12015 [Streptomyces albidoflavus]
MSEDHRTTAPPGLRRALVAAVARPRKAVDAPRGSGVDTRRTLHSLALHIGEAELEEADADQESLAFADPSRPYELDAGGVEVDGDGVGVVEWAQVTSVTGQFRLECGDGRTVYGQAESWTVDGAGVLDCQEPLTDAAPTARDAALLACGGDEPANTGAKPKAPEGAKKTS